MDEIFNLVVDNLQYKEDTGDIHVVLPHEIYVEIESDEETFRLFKSCCDFLSEKIEEEIGRTLEREILH